MGGTTAKASLIENGEVTRATEYQVGAGIVLGSRLLSGAGYTLKVPAIDLAEVGAGGGSILWIDAGGALQVGPTQRRRGAGPGLLRPGRQRADRHRRQSRARLPQPGASGRRRAEAQRRRRRAAVIADKIARPLGMSVEAAAYGAHLIAASNMIRALEGGVERARPRPARIRAGRRSAATARCSPPGWPRRCGIPQVLIPPSAGVFSSFGLLYAEIEYYFTRTRKRLLRGVDAGGGRRRSLDGLEAEARARLGEDGFAADRIEIRRSASLHYQGQSFELRVPLAAGPARPRRAGRRSKKPSAPSTSAPTATAPGSRSRSNWSASKSIGRGIPDQPRAASAAAAEPRPRHRDRRAAPPRLFRPAAGLARRRGDQPQRPRDAARRPVHRRGIRRHLPRPARLDGQRSTSTAISR